MLQMKQLYYNNKAVEGDYNAKIKLHLVNLDIKKGFSKEAEDTILHINTQEIEESESMNIYHHQLHKKKMSRTAILKLETPDRPIYGHKKCSEFIA